MATVMTERSEAYVEIHDSDGTLLARHQIEGVHALIGRSEKAHVLLDSKRISRLHAEIYRDPFGRWWVRDLESRNGIKVNGNDVIDWMLRTGDTIKIGDFYMVFRLIYASAEDKALGELTAAPISTNSQEDSEIQVFAGMDPVKIDARHLQTLISFGTKMLETENQKLRLELLCRLMIRRDFRGRVAAVLRMSKTEPDSPPQMLFEARSRVGGEPLPYVSRGLLRVVRASEAPALASNVTPGGDVVGLSLSSDVEPMSALACPLRNTSRYLDVLYAVLPPEFGRSEWLALAQLASMQYQQAETAWAARRQAQRQAVISGELERATELQQSLIPKDVKINGLDWAVGFKPCRWVGGDYVDVVRAPGGKVLLIIADVSGKGLQAALVSSSLHTMVHTALKAGLDLAQIFHSLNDYLCETLIDSSFVTMAAVLLDPETGKLDCVNAGHLPVLVMSNDGGAKRELQSAVHLPLGVVADMPVEVQSDTLEKGEMLAMYTDGITELYDGTQRNKLLGIERFAGFLESICESTAGKPVSRAGKQLTDLLDKLQTPLRFADDRTFLLARRD